MPNDFYSFYDVTVAIDFKKREIKYCLKTLFWLSVAKCAIFSPNLAFFIWLAGEICVWRVADFLAILAIFRRKFWRIFAQDLDQCLVHKKNFKNPFKIV